MNGAQKKVLIAVVVVIVGMLLCPPYEMVYNGNIIDSGYSLIFDIPDRATVNVGTLIAQWFGVIIAGAVGFFAMKSK